MSRAARCLEGNVIVVMLSAQTCSITQEYGKLRMIHETTGSRPWTLALTSVAFFMVVLDSLVVITALPAIRSEFGASLAALQWIVNAFTLAFASGIITGPALGDRFGRRRIFGIGFLILTAASVASALSSTPC